MAKQIFINLVVNDLEKSMNVYTQMGFTNNPQFSDETGKCMVWSDTIFVMIMLPEKFKGFATKSIADTKHSQASIFSLSVDSLAEMNKIADAAKGAGCVEPVEMKDYGFMQLRTLEDLDGYMWEVFYMDMTKFPSA